MVSSKYFSINDGPDAGVYCSYCGEKLTPEKDEETGGFYYQCDCADARAEIVLLDQQNQLAQKVEKFYAQREKMIKKTQLSKHRANMERQLQELTQSLKELDDEDDSTPDVSNDGPSRAQLESAGSDDSLKMTGPKLPKFGRSS